MNTGPVWIIDDDQDDRFMVEEIWKELDIKNELIWFNAADKVIEHFKKVDRAPFIIISDVNLHKIHGFELREFMLNQTDRKFHSVPFIFWSSYATEEQILKAYELSAHGFFIKQPVYEEVKESFIEILRYWQKSKMPSKKV